MRLLLCLLLTLTALAQDYDGLEVVQLLGRLDLPHEQSIDVLVVKNSGGYPVMLLDFHDMAGELRLYLNRPGWDQLARLQPAMQEGFEQVTAQDLNQVGPIKGYQIKSAPPSLRVTLLEQTPLVPRQLVLTVSRPGQRLVFPLPKEKAAELAGLLSQARQLTASP